jgi:predicted metalloprotease
MSQTTLRRAFAGAAGTLGLLAGFVMSTSATAAPARRPLCSTHHSTHAITQCLRGALSNYWSGELNEFVSEPVHIAAHKSEVPRPCRPAIDSAPAFTCKTNLSLYINQPLLHVINKFISRSNRRYAFAAVQGHEMGHVLQYTLHQPQIEHRHPTLRQIRYVEQQADCLDGVWARNEVDAGRLNRVVFRHVAVKMIKLVSTNDEVRTHGTPHQRAEALDRGLHGGRPQACHLASFG